MIHIQSLSAEIEIGEFHDIVGVDTNNEFLSLFTRMGEELFIPLVRHYDQDRQSYCPLKLEGLFPPLNLEVKSGRAVEGINPVNVTGISVSKMKRFPDFQTKRLRIFTQDSLTFCWKLFCDL